MSSVSALILCDEPPLAARIASAMEPIATPTGDRAALETAAVVVWTDSGGALAEVAAAAPDAEIIAVTARELDGVIDCLRPDRVSHFVHPDAVARSLRPIVAKLCGDAELFGLSAYLPGADVAFLELDTRDGRDRALEAVDQLATANRMRRTARERITNACDELLMNALYDAPIDDRGELVFGSVSPSERRSMRSPRPVSLRYAVAGDQLAVSVTDRYGRLDKTTVLDTLEKCLRSDDPIDDKPLGAGLGLYITASIARNLIVNVEPGAATEVIATFSRDHAPLEVLGFFCAGRRADA